MPAERSPTPPETERSRALPAAPADAPLAGNRRGWSIAGGGDGLAPRHCRWRPWSAIAPRSTASWPAHGLRRVAAFVALYIAVVALSLPGALDLTSPAASCSARSSAASPRWSARTVGATVDLPDRAQTAFGEYLMRRAGPLAARLAEGFRADAFSYLLFLRLVPFPFWLVNLVAGAGRRAACAPSSPRPRSASCRRRSRSRSLGAGLDSVIIAQEAMYRSCLAAGGTNCRLDFDLKRGDHAAADRRAGGARLLPRSFRSW